MFYHEYSSYYVTKDKIKVTGKKKKLLLKLRSQDPTEF